MSRRLEMLLVTTLLGVALLISLASMRTLNETADEVPHIAAAYSYLHKGDFRLNAEHPPLAKEIAALPLLLLKPKFDDCDPSWNYSRAWEVGRKFLYRWNTPERIVFWARVPMVGLYLGLALLLWSASRRLYGPAAGLVGLLLALFTPELLAHGQLVTNDLAISLFFFATIWWFNRAVAEDGWRNILLFAIACGCAVATKHTASILLLILILLAGVYLFFAGRLGDLPARPLRTRLMVIFRLAGVAFASTVLIVWAVYGFRFTISPDLEILVPWEEYATGRFLPQQLLMLRDWKLLPEAYLAGLLDGLRMLSVHQGFLFGELYAGGRWYYFPVSFLLKTPLPLLLLVLATLRWKSELKFSSCCLLLPPAIYLLVAMQSEVNIGNRHILPIYPFLIVWAAQCGRVFDADHARSAWLRPGRWQRLGLGLLLVWLVVGTIRVYPNFLSYFNELAGGHQGGARYLADSNIDWGQNLKGLASYQRQHPEEQLSVCYFGSADPAYYLPGATTLPCFFDRNEPFVPPPPGSTVAISQNLLHGILLRDDPQTRAFVARVKGGIPFDRIGDSILLYRLP